MTTEAAPNDARAVTDGDTVLATMDLPAPPERVFMAITTEEVERWWGSATTYRVTDWNADLRVGGRWHMVVRFPDGASVPTSGIFHTVDAPTTLVQSQIYAPDGSAMGGRETIVTYQLAPIVGGTRLTVRHDGFGGLQAPAAHHALGWERFLRFLAAHLAHAGS